VRQVARRVAVEPLRADMSAEDSIPFRAVARDARNIRIADATITISTTVITTHGIWAGPITVGPGGATGVITPALSGVARPEANPLAPQIATVIDESVIAIHANQTVVAGSAASALTVSGVAFDSTGKAAAGRTVFFAVSSGATPGNAAINSDGSFSQIWTLPTVADHYTLTGIFDTSTETQGRVVLRRSVTVTPDVPSETRTTVTISNATLAVNGTATLQVTVRDRFGNVVKTATPADFVASANAGGGTFSGAACTLGVCTVTYTAKATPGADVIRIQVQGVDVLGSPINVTVQ
jgi:hypothetical protein